MHFALVGDHPDGLAFARTLVESGRHELVAYHGSPAGFESLRQVRPGLQSIPDLEELLIDPRIEAVIVAGRPRDRAQQLRRALQSEHHVLCVHPADNTPDAAYEAAMIQHDTQRVLLPLLPEALHPGVAGLAELAQPDGSLGTLQLVECERLSPHPILLDAETDGARPALPGWDVLRAIGGEIAEVSGMAAGEHLSPEEPVVMAGRFERGGLFEVRLIPRQQQTCGRLAAVGARARAELTFPAGWAGPATLRWRDEPGIEQEESWPTWNPWLPILQVFEAAVSGAAAAPSFQETAARPADAGGSASSAGKSQTTSLLTWQAAIRAQELDDALRRSVAKRRASTLEYPEATEETGFKGTMTLVGCGLLWVVLLLAILAAWFPLVGWLIIPVLVFFLGLQILRWVVKQPENKGDRGR
jgi:predicted dehydrogenase